MAIFKGAGVAIVTPMKDDGGVDYESFEKMIETQISEGTDAIVVCGTTGEAATLSEEEHLEVIQFCVKTVNGRIPVIAGTGSNCTKTAIYLSQSAEQMGVDGLLLVNPYYNKATQNGIYKHFKAIAEAVNKPILLYNVPSRTGCNILPDTIIDLCNDVPNIVGVKEASGNISQIAYLAAKAEGKVDIYSGNDDQIVPILSLGGIGVISVLSNVAPKYTHDICWNYFEGNVEKSCKMQLDSIPLFKTLISEVNPIPVKKALELMGKCGGYLRMPLSEMEEENVNKLKVEMKKFGLL